MWIRWRCARQHNFGEKLPSVAPPCHATVLPWTITQDDMTYLALVALSCTEPPDVGRHAGRPDSSRLADTLLRSPSSRKDPSRRLSPWRIPRDVAGAVAHHLGSRGQSWMRAALAVS